MALGTAPTEPPSKRDRRFLYLALYGSFMAGLGLRLWNLRGQVIGGDELHAVRAALRMTLPEILTTYSLTDNSIPLTALFRLWMDWGITLSELAFRLPSILCGLIALIAMPRAMLGKVDRVAVELYGVLLALSPCMVLYSRIARSYMPMILLSFGAVLAFEAWWRTRTWRYGVFYVVLAALAVWIHLGAAPFVASPFLFAAGDLIWRRGERFARMRDLVILGAGLGLAFAAFLLPARESLEKLIANKRREQTIPLDTVWDVLRMEAGTPSHTVAILFWVAALAGLVLLLRDRPRVALYTLTLAAGHLIGMRMLSPFGLGHPLVLNRYLLPVLPFILLWVAYALRRPWVRDAGCSGRMAQRYVGTFLFLLIIWTGPFLSRGFRKSSFMHHNDFVGFFASRATLPAEVVPEIYRRLPRGPVLEAPWPTAWDFGRVFYIYQGIHGRRVMVSAVDLPGDPRIDLRNEVTPEPQAILASRARTLVVHVKLPWEEDRVQVPPGRPPTRRMRPKARQDLRRAGERLAARLAREWGPPNYADGVVRAWDLERVRAGRETSPP
ncbi:MAG TPA: hypothetical protein VF756_00525 [Thermoanaerobaculia bacterium]